jgi:hypothetical protein
MKRLFLIAPLLLSACAMVPNSIRPELEHMTHVSQPEPLTHPQYAADIASIVLHWDLPKRFTLELAEGFVIEPRSSPVSFGEIVGPREQFTMRLAYVFTLK